MRRILAAAVVLFGLVALAGPAPAATPGPPTRSALVIGESAYRTAGSAEFSVNDAHAVAEALDAAGWRVEARYDLDRPGLLAALQGFAARLKPGDAALVYFSGLSAKGSSGERGGGLENYLLPIEAAPASIAELPNAGVGLSAVLTALTQAGATAQVVILDAARPNVFESRWGSAPGLVEPTTSAVTTNAYVVFPAQPGRIAAENRFAPELAKALAAPGASTGQTFTDLSARLDRLTGGQQIPWFSGAGASARLVLNPSRPAGPGGDKQRYSEAIACGSQACLNGAAAAVSDPGMKMDLMLRAAVATVEDLPPPVTTAPATPVDYVDAFVEANRSSPAGMGRIGRNYLNGEGGFPKNSGQAYTWLMRGASGGDKDAAYLVALFFDRGLPPVGRVDQYAAIGYFQTAAKQGEHNAEYEVGRYYFNGWGGLAKDPAQARAWMERAAAGGVASAKDVLAGKKTP